MNWKNVLFLMRVERKSGRLLRGIKATRYKENSILAYWPYWAAAIIGILGGFFANFVASLAYSNGATSGLQPLNVAASSYYAVLPTLVLGISLVFTLLQQIQLAGKASGQLMYWLPVTWQEHTLASILANLMGWPVSIVIGISSGLIVFSAFNALILPAILTTLVLFAAAFIGSSITEILRTIISRFTGAVYKSSGRAAIWVRLVTYLTVIIIFYILYFYVTQQFTSFITTLTAAQSATWYVPFIWLALLLSYALKGFFLQSILFAALSALFIAGLYYLAVYLNQHFGLYEPPAIRVQTSGVYVPKTGLLGKIGFSSVEAAIIRKDLRAFTRRREMLGIFIAPIIMIIVPLMNSLGVIGSGSAASPVNPFFAGIIFLLPAGFMAMLVGEILIGEEGQAVWRIYASPISPKNLVRSKFFMVALFSIAMLLISGAIGVAFYRPSIKYTIVVLIETFFLVLALGSVSLAVGFKGADFSQTRRARMIRQEWSLIGLIVCALVGAAVLAPLTPYLIAVYASAFIPGLSATLFSLAIYVVISGIISAAITAVFYKINISLAKDLLGKAQV